MNSLYLILLTCSQILMGYGAVAMHASRLNKLQVLSISLITGMGIMSLVPAILQLSYIPLTVVNIFSSIAALTIVFSLMAFKRLKQVDFRELIKCKIHLYDWPWLILIGVMVFIAVCNSVLFPPTPRDILSGPEPIAHFALTEHTFINSVYDQDMPMNNGPFKSLYIPSLQLIYKLIGFTMGKIWMVTLGISFLVFLYSTIRENYIHPVLAGAGMALFVFTPELYAYTYLVLYDYSNMLFLFLSLYFLKDYVIEGVSKPMMLSAIFMALATYIRPETLILVVIIAIYTLLVTIVKKRYAIKHLLPVIVFGTASALVYFFTSYLYLNYYLPVHYDIETVMNNNPADLSPLVDRLKEITFTLVYSQWGLLRYGYIFAIATSLFILDLAIYRRLSQEAAFWAMLFLLVYLGIAVIGYLLPLADLMNTTKRALFKLVPIALMYIANSNSVRQLSAKLYKMSAQGTRSNPTQAAVSSSGQIKRNKRKK